MELGEKLTIDITDKLSDLVSELVEHGSELHLFPTYIFFHFLSIKMVVWQRAQS